MSSKYFHKNVSFVLHIGEIVCLFDKTLRDSLRLLIFGKIFATEDGDGGTHASFYTSH